jgi:hypothetical protein
VQRPPETLLGLPSAGPVDLDRVPVPLLHRGFPEQQVRLPRAVTVRVPVLRFPSHGVREDQRADGGPRGGGGGERLAPVTRLREREATVRRAMRLLDGRERFAEDTTDAHDARTVSALMSAPRTRGATRRSGSPDAA